MREISQKEYEELRTSGSTLLGRAIPSENSQNVIFFAIDASQKKFSCTEILDTLSLTHRNLNGKFDVVRHWAYPEIKTINY